MPQQVLDCQHRKFELTIYKVLNGNKKIADVIQQTKFNNLNLVSSNVDLSGLEVETAGDSRRAL